MQTKVKDVMKYNPVTIMPDRSLKEAAQTMHVMDCGVLPVGTPEKVEGVITDRDIVLRAVAKGKDVVHERVKGYMTTELYFCKADDTLESAAEIMHTHHVNRLLVNDSTGHICGILSFGAILRKDERMHDIDTVLGCTVGKKAVA